MEAEPELQTEDDRAARLPASVTTEAQISDELRRSREEMTALRAEIVGLREQLARAERPAEPEPMTRTPLQRGNYYVGGTASLSYRTRDDYETLLGAIDDGHRLSTQVEGLFGYVLRNDQLSVGMSVAYRNTLRKGVLTDPSTGAVDDVNSAEYELRIGPAARGFLPLDKGKRFFVYAQAALLFGYGERVERVFSDTTSSVLSANGFSMGLAVQPGLMIAASKNFAFEVGINVLGIDYQNYRVTTDYTNTGKQKDVDLSVDVNLLSLQFAFVGYF